MEILSCRHLLRLAKQLKLSQSIVDLYEQDLKRLMESDDVKGVSEEILFRNYDRKMNCAINFTRKLEEY